MVINNTATAQGDVISFSTEVPIIGLVALLSFTSDTENETITDYFSKSFQYSVDGINFSDWLPLTTENVIAITPVPNRPFKANYRYERVGNGSTPLVFNNVFLSGDLIDITCGPYFKRSVFSENFSCTDTEAIGWALNVCEKIYRGNVMPSYLEREEYKDQYVALIYSMTLLFGFIVKQLRISTDLSRPGVAKFFLENYGNIVGENQTEEQIVYILSHVWKDFFNRGTNEIFKRTDGSGTGRIVDGEFLRLIECSFDQYFLVGYVPYSWILGKTSPSCYNLVDESLYLNTYSGNTVSFDVYTTYIHLHVDGNFDYVLTFDISATPGELSVSITDGGESYLTSVGNNPDGKFVDRYSGPSFVNKKFAMKIYSKDYLGSDYSSVCNIPGSGHVKFFRDTGHITIAIQDTDGGNGTISNIRFSPMKTERSKNQNIAIFAKNNSSRTLEEVRDIAQRVLLPVGETIKLNLA